MRTYAATHMLKNKKGFSLVELMVVVAIIGILASIAVPSLQRYMAKARQSEAKTTLASLYTAEKAFFAEYNTYETCFDGLGFQPEGQMRYNTGFGAASGVPVANYGYSGTCTPGNMNTAVGAICDSAPANTGRPCTLMAEGQGTSLGSGSATAGVFTASAKANIYATSGTTDGWSIDQNKHIVNCFDGINGTAGSQACP